MLLVNRKGEQSVTTDERRTKVLVLIKRRCMVIELLEISEETTTKMQCLTEEVAFRVKTNVIVILI